MAENKKYYYMKLREDFFESDEIVLLRNEKDGVYYVNILLWLYLKSLKSNGRLLLNAGIPYTADTITALSHNQIGTVQMALEAFYKYGLIEILSDESIYMTNIESMVGQSSSEGDRKRKARAALKAQNLLIEAVDARP